MGKASTVRHFGDRVSTDRRRDGVGREGKWGRSRRWLGWGFGIAMIVEDSIISLQSARGVRSHMNYTMLLDGILFGVMGLFIILNTTLAGGLLAMWCVAKTKYKRVVVWSVRLGLLLLVVASAEGARMVMLGGHGGWRAGRTSFELEHRTWRPADSAFLRAARVADFSSCKADAGFDSIAGATSIALLFGFAIAYSAGVWWLFAEAIRGIPAVQSLAI